MTNEQIKTFALILVASWVLHVTINATLKLMH
jgi:hypothetical protein